MNSAKLSDIVTNLGLEVINKSSDYDHISLDTAEMNRPGLQLAGYMVDFPYKRLQVIGLVEHNYYSDLNPRLRYERFKNFLTYKIPALIFARKLEITDDILELSVALNKTVLRSNLITTALQSKLSLAISDLLAEEISLHGGMVDVYGLGPGGQQLPDPHLTCARHRRTEGHVLPAVLGDGGHRKVVGRGIWRQYRAVAVGSVLLSPSQGNESIFAWFEKWLKGDASWWNDLYGKE